MKGIVIQNNAIVTNVTTQGGLITGGFRISDVARQNVDLILGMNKGELKENPLMGVGISDYLNSENFGGLRFEINRQLKADGMKVSKLELNNETLNIQADYE